MPGYSLTSLRLCFVMQFQCRVGSGDGGYSSDLLKQVVLNLGNEHGNPGQLPWWGANLNMPNFHSATLWLSSGIARTPLHSDAQNQVHRQRITASLYVCVCVCVRVWG